MPKFVLLLTGLLVSGIVVAKDDEPFTLNQLHAGQPYVYLGLADELGSDGLMYQFAASYYYRSDEEYRCGRSKSWLFTSAELAIYGNLIDGNQQHDRGVPNLGLMAAETVCDGHGHYWRLELAHQFDTEEKNQRDPSTVRGSSARFSHLRGLHRGSLQIDVKAGRYTSQMFTEGRGSYSAAISYSESITKNLSSNVGIASYYFEGSPINPALRVGATYKWLGLQWMLQSETRFNTDDRRADERDWFIALGVQIPLRQYQ